MYGTGVTFITGRVNASAILPEVLKSIGGANSRPEKITTKRAVWEQAPDALLDSSAKVVIVR